MSLFPAFNKKGSFESMCCCLDRLQINVKAYLYKLALMMGSSLEETLMPRDGFSFLLLLPINLAEVSIQKAAS